MSFYHSPYVLRLAGRRGPRGAAAAHAAGGGWRPEELGTVRRLQHMLRYWHS